MKSNYLLKKIAISISLLLFAFSANAQRDRLNVSLDLPTGDVENVLNASIEANDPAVGPDNGDGIQRVVFQLINRNNFVFDRTAFRGTRNNPLTGPFNASFDTTEFPDNFIVRLRIRVIGFPETTVINGRRRRVTPRRTIVREFRVNNNTTPEVPPVIPDSAPTTPTEELNRIVATLDVQDGATFSGEFSATVTATDPFAGRGNNNGDGIARINIRVLDANSGAILAGTDFARGGGLGGFTFLAPPPFTANFEADRIVSSSQQSREVIIQANIQGFVQNSQVTPGERIQPTTTIERRATVTNNSGGRPTRFVVASPNANTIDVSTPNRIRSIQILDFSFQVLQEVTFSGNSFNESVILNSNVPGVFVVNVNNRQRRVVARGN